MTNTKTTFNKILEIIYKKTSKEKGNFIFRNCLQDNVLDLITILLRVKLHLSAISEQILVQISSNTTRYC